MTKRELARQIADGGEVPEKLALWAIEAVCEEIAGALSRGEAVSLPGFGKFAVAERTGREARLGRVRGRSRRRSIA